ncbi:60S acidic ribosomal protein P1 [Hesseltinella vesiculosa]|uniref:60S acidic ribosomal protein P1 n=1 Tax=Hesseltinella vesiculosa TaxID=101127 RepID=A0A1X2GPR2_9FUNG|nr:60S acidic ribosomal protein P1 [Hesseltinella vesiculosa]
MSAELAIVYAALILQDDNIEITEDKLQTLVKAASVEVEPIWFSLYTKAFAGQDLNELLTKVGSPGAGPTVAGGIASGYDGTTAGEVVEQEKEQEKEESDDDMGFGLFD